MSKVKENINPITAKRLIHEADLASTGTPDLFKVLDILPEGIRYAIDLFLSEFDYAKNKTSNRAIALRVLASTISALTLSIESAEKSLNIKH